MALRIRKFDFVVNNILAGHKLHILLLNKIANAEFLNTFTKIDENCASKI